MLFLHTTGAGWSWLKRLRSLFCLFQTRHSQLCVGPVRVMFAPCCFALLIMPGENLKNRMQKVMAVVSNFVHFFNSRKRKLVEEVHQFAVCPFCQRVVVNCTFGGNLTSTFKTISIRERRLFSRAGNCNPNGTQSQKQ